uniref:HECT-type E3 ubiquitin transferase n=1 Tax=Soboliphyme baturini TaxID=241478 RepID=A0A183IVW6_9BILA
MKICRTKLKKQTPEPPPDVKVLIDEILSYGNLKELANFLCSIRTWQWSKSELCHWIDVLDLFDDVLEEACRRNPDSWLLECDRSEPVLLPGVLNFTSHLFEHTFSRHLYNSMEHLITLLESSRMNVVLSTLSLLYVFSKRSSFLTHIPRQQRDELMERLTCLAESWGGSSYGSPSTCSKANYFVHMENVDKMTQLPGEIMDDILTTFKVPKEKQIVLFCQLRLAQYLGDYGKRLQCILARLKALSVIMYAGYMTESCSVHLSNGFVEECIELLKSLSSDSLWVSSSVQCFGNRQISNILTTTPNDIRTEILKTLTAMIYLDRQPRLNIITERTNASYYHGFLPTMVRSCISYLLQSSERKIPHSFITALFSFLYYMAGYDSAGDALISSGLTDTLLSVVRSTSILDENITFVTRSVRIIDLFTTTDSETFQILGGMPTFIHRLTKEVELCRQQMSSGDKGDSTMDSEPLLPEHETGSPEMETDLPKQQTAAKGCCAPQRAALIKSLLNFVKKAIQDPMFSESVRHIMDGPLPEQLLHVIQNPDYYGSSLFLLAINVFTSFIFNEPSQLSTLQEKGVTTIIMEALLVKEVCKRQLLA